MSWPLCVRREALGLALVLALLPVPVLAASTPPGVNLRWDHCLGDAGVMNKTFACDTNTGQERLVLSFELSAPISGVLGLSFRVVRESASPTLPAWWRFVGDCRGFAQDLVTTPPLGSVSCLDWGAGLAYGGIDVTTDTVSTFEPAQAALGGVVGVPYTNPVNLSPGIEYFIGVIQITHAKTVGAGSCAGCDVPVCIVFASLQVGTADDPMAAFLLDGANGPDSQIATWQNGHVANLDNHCTPQYYETPCYTSMDCSLGVVKARASTWGQVKALYR